PLPRAAPSFPTRRSSDLARWNSGSGAADCGSWPPRSEGPAGLELYNSSTTDFRCDTLGTCASPAENLRRLPGVSHRKSVDDELRSEEHTSELQSRRDLVC